MTPRMVRIAERWVHLGWALLIALHVYGLLPTWRDTLVRWVVVPGLVGSGLAMWFAAPLRRLARAHLTSSNLPSSRTSEPARGTLRVRTLERAR